MERVTNDGFFSYRRDVERKRGKRSSAISSSDLFSRTLASSASSAVTPEVTDAEVADLLDHVFSTGDTLRRELTSANLEEYRRAVREFLSAFVQRGLDVDEHTSGNVLKRKRYTMIRVIDARLEALVAGMVQSQSSQLELLAKVDEINGLLVDLIS